MSAEDTELLEPVRRYYEARLREHGPSAAGVDWNSAESQRVRFEQLLKVVPPGVAGFSINDYGCGCGALLGYLTELGLEIDYRGFDLSAEMTASASKIYHQVPGASFFSDPGLLRPADYTVASGLFNVKLGAAGAVWESYVEETLSKLVGFSRQGLAFNLLTSYSDEDRMRDRLYYADPRVVFDDCKRRYSRWVAVLHDYGLYEFTVLVRRDTRTLEVPWPD